MSILARGAAAMIDKLTNLLPDQTSKIPVVMSNDLRASTLGGWSHSQFDGDKFAGGFGATQVPWTDYWTLRQRSAQLFNENPYAKGLIRRLITNEINTGLTPESSPNETILGMPEESLNDWTEGVENRFGLWGKNPNVCDWKKTSTFGSIQKTARREALIDGDILIVLRYSRQTGLPSVQLIKGDRVQTPIGGNDAVRSNNKVQHGVEMEESGRVVAHHVRQSDGSYRRLPAFGERSGRRISWLYYGTEKRLDEVRGQPLLALVLQSLKEIDRYRDSTQRKAVINSMLAMFVKKTEEKMGSLPVTRGAVRRDAVTVVGDSDKRSFNVEGLMPGVIMEELQTGEEPVLLGGQGTDQNFATFEEAIIRTYAWANEMPPEILQLSFGSNYSASQAAINEFKIYLNRIWSEFGEDLCTPIYETWLIAETLNQRIAAPGLLNAWRDDSQYDVFGAWTNVEWYGSIKPSTDMLKQVKASELLVAGGYSTRARESRIMSGAKYSHNAKRLKRENEQLVEANRPLAEFEAEFAKNPAAQAEDDKAKDRARKEDDTEAMVVSTVESILDDRGME